MFDKLIKYMFDQQTMTLPYEQLFNFYRKVFK